MIYRYKGENRQKEESKLNMAGRLNYIMRGERGTPGGGGEMDQERCPGSRG